MKQVLHQRIKNTLLTALLAAAMFWAAAPAHAQQQTDSARNVTAFGSSGIIKDVGGARNAAVSAALLESVRTAASDVLPRQVLRENFGEIAGILDEKHQQFIEDYRILEEHQGERNLYVLIQASVSNDRIRRAFEEEGIETSPARMPSILLMIAEKNVDDLDFEYWWRGGYGGFADPSASPAIKQVFAQKGFTVVDPPSQDTEGSALLEGMKPDAEPADYEASMIAARLGADLAVTGTAEAEATANRMGREVRTFRAAVNLKVIDAETGEKLTTIRQQAMTVSREPETGGKNAMADAAFKAGKTLSGRLQSLWRKGSGTEEEFAVSVKGEALLSHLEQFRNTVRKQSGVSGVRTTEMTAKSATLGVDYEGTAQELADRLLMHSFDEFGVNISDISTEGMSVELIYE